MAKAGITSSNAQGDALTFRLLLKAKAHNGYLYLNLAAKEAKAFLCV